VAETILVIGIHREELTFGKRVAELSEGSRIDVLHIGQGLSSKKPVFDDLFYYTTRHREIYLQLHQQLKKKYGTVIDLHTGINESGRCADVFCKHINLLDCLETTLKKRSDIPCRLPGTIQLVRIVADSTETNQPSMNIRKEDAKQEKYAVCRTVIPQTVWASKDFVYVGLEIYLPRPGMGSRKDWLFTANIIDCIYKCGESFRNDSLGQVA
jgi:hypothetical protein